MIDGFGLHTDGFDHAADGEVFDGSEITVANFTDEFYGFVRTKEKGQTNNDKRSLCMDWRVVVLFYG